MESLEQKTFFLVFHFFRLIHTLEFTLRNFSRPPPRFISSPPVAPILAPGLKKSKYHCPVLGDFYRSRVFTLQKYACHLTAGILPFFCSYIEKDIMRIFASKYARSVKAVKSCTPKQKRYLLIRGIGITYVKQKNA